MMTMKLVFSAITATMLAVPVFAQEANTTAGNEATSAPQSMKGMMDKCRVHCTDTQREITATTEAIQKAKTSDDIETMREALGKAETSLSKMSGNMTKCLSMMEMMGNMEGMMDGQGMMGGEGMMSGTKTE